MIIYPVPRVKKLEILALGQFEGWLAMPFPVLLSCGGCETHFVILDFQVFERA
jgi:hypothetical protein